MLKNGTYEATAKGQMNDITLEVTVDNNKIEKINIIKEDETPGIGDIALERIPKAIIQKQSVEVDSVSGATVTSNAVISAVKEALTEAEK
ncbi:MULTISPECIES: FMN-binding protein [Aerococcus]|uniref:FMN-binding protein n=1 Tax=Aerococcus tenax TaxID=3078812 RepID=A0A5N1BP55_9LACT|nr:FMN-binding protein [Aerococcus urinae]KAA9240361.1 FMN-binding protein [Aerococcus urinae]MDK7302776.1 FMN-binding protein [Aerococcus urinae]MDK7801440.1 FMN-binding protein [Aerococcus urinae]MDK8655020.1 FMN-binding protein [Aerococcus urinae]RAV70813.1 FMN-binding protein [Aerococcus urinae]